MDFSIGDQVVHPKHGAGQITGKEQLQLVEGFEKEKYKVNTHHQSDGTIIFTLSLPYSIEPTFV